VHTKTSAFSRCGQDQCPSEEHVEIPASEDITDQGLAAQIPAAPRSIPVAASRSVAEAPADKLLRGPYGGQKMP